MPKSKRELEAEATAKKQQEEADKARLVEAKRLEDAREDRYRQAEEARVRAEERVKALEEQHAQAAALAQASQQASQNWTEEQWAQAEQQTGLNRQQLQASWAIANERAQASSKAFQDQLQQEQKRNKELEGRLGKMETSSKADKMKAAFFSQRPEFDRYRANVDKFLVQYEDQDNPEKLGARLEMAAVYVKGEVGDKFMKEPQGGGSPRLNTNPQPMRVGDKLGQEDIDATGLQEHEERLVRSLARKNEDRIEGIRDLVKDDHEGIVISTQSEWERAKPVMPGQVGRAGQE